MAEGSDDRRTPDEDETQLLRRAMSGETARDLGERLGGQAMLEVYDVNGDLLEIVPVPETGLTIGRSLDQDVRLADPTVSRRHARVVFADRRYWLEDTGSRNETLLNEEPIRGRTELFDGAHLSIGLHSLIVTIR